MKEEQYREICEICDKILISDNLPVERIAIPWLHLLREHPIFTKKYQVLFEEKKWYKIRLKYRVLEWCKILAMVGRQFYRAAIFKNKNFSLQNKISSKYDILFISHLVNVNQVNKKEDFYYGDIPNKLQEQGLKIIIAYIDYTKNQNNEMIEDASSSSVTKFILPKSLGIKKDWLILKRLLKEYKNIGKLKLPNMSEIELNAKKIAQREALSSGAMSALRLGIQIEELVTKYKTKNIITTFEGHSWERVVFSYARKSLPSIKCIGYQHAAIFRLQYSMLRPLSKDYDPNYILVTGNTSANQIKNRIANSIPIFILGSNRYINDKIIISEKDESYGKENKLSVLVLPEGFVSECIILFEYSIKCANKFKNVKFIWRLHPLIDFEKFRKLSNKFKKLPSNIIISKEELSFDINRSHWALYRGSTSIIQAVQKGLMPIYLQEKDEMSIDPLFEIQKYTNTIKKIEDFSELVNNYYNNKKCKEEQKKVMDYCSSYYNKPDPELLNLIIKM